MVKGTDDLLRLLGEAAARHPYRAFSEVAPTDTGGAALLVPSTDSPLRFLPFKDRWYLVEFLGFDGLEFLWAVLRSLRARAPTPGEIEGAGALTTPWDKLAFVIAVNEDNRREGIPVRVVDIRVATVIHGVTRRFGRGGPARIGRAAAFVFRLYAHRRVASLAPHLLTQRLMWTALARGIATTGAPRA